MALGPRADAFHVRVNLHLNPGLVCCTWTTFIMHRLLPTIVGSLWHPPFGQGTQLSGGGA